MDYLGIFQKKKKCFGILKLDFTRQLRMSSLSQIKDFLKFFVRPDRCRLRQMAFSSWTLEHIFKAKSDGKVYTRCFRVVLSS